MYLFFNWRISSLQYSIGFCQTSTWISHRYNYAPPSGNFFPPPQTCVRLRDFPSAFPSAWNSPSGSSESWCPHITEIKVFVSNAVFSEKPSLKCCVSLLFTLISNWNCAYFHCMLLQVIAHSARTGTLFVVYC